MEKRLYAVSVYERWDDGEWEFRGYIGIYHTRSKAIEFAYHSSSFDTRYYDVEIMSEAMIRADRLEDLIKT